MDEKNNNWVNEIWNRGNDNNFMNNDTTSERLDVPDVFSKKNIASKKDIKIKDNSVLAQFKENYNSEKMKYNSELDNKFKAILRIIKPNIREALEKYESLFNITELEYAEHIIINNLRDLFMKDKIKDIGDYGICIGGVSSKKVPIDEYVFNYLSNKVKDDENINFSNYYLEMYDKIKRVVIEIYKKIEFECSSLIGNSNYVNSLVNEYIIKYLEMYKGLPPEFISLDNAEIKNRMLMDADEIRQLKNNKKEYKKQLEFVLATITLVGGNVFALGGLFCCLYSDFISEQKKKEDYNNMLYNFFPPNYNPNKLKKK